MPIALCDWTLGYSDRCVPLPPYQMGDYQAFILFISHKFYFYCYYLIILCQVANYVCKKIVSSFVWKRNLKLKEDLINLLEITIKKADIKLDEIHNCLKKKEGKFCLIFCLLQKLTWKSKLMHHGSCLFLFLK